MHRHAESMKDYQCFTYKSVLFCTSQHISCYLTQIIWKTPHGAQNDVMKPVRRAENIHVCFVFVSTNVMDDSGAARIVLWLVVFGETKTVLPGFKLLSAACPSVWDLKPDQVDVGSAALYLPVKILEIWPTATSILSGVNQYITSEHDFFCVFIRSAKDDTEF